MTRTEKIIDTVAFIGACISLFVCGVFALAMMNPPV